MSENSQPRQGGSYTKDPKTGIRTLVSRTKPQEKKQAAPPVPTPDRTTNSTKPKEVNDGAL